MRNTLIAFLAMKTYSVLVRRNFHSLHLENNYAPTLYPMSSDIVIIFRMMYLGAGESKDDNSGEVARHYWRVQVPQMQMRRVQAGDCGMDEASQGAPAQGSELLRIEARHTELLHQRVPLQALQGCEF